MASETSDLSPRGSKEKIVIQQPRAGAFKADEECSKITDDTSGDESDNSLNDATFALKKPKNGSSRRQLSGSIAIFCHGVIVCDFRLGIIGTPMRRCGNQLMLATGALCYVLEVGVGTGQEWWCETSEQRIEAWGDEMSKSLRVGTR